MTYSAQASFGVDADHNEKAQQKSRPDEKNFSQFAKRIVLDYLDGKLVYANEIKSGNLKELLDKARLRKLDAEATLLENRVKLESLMPNPTPEAQKALEHKVKIENANKLKPNFSITNNFGLWIVRCEVETALDPQNKIISCCDWKFESSTEKYVYYILDQHLKDIHGKLRYEDNLTQ